jgi:hypothetical protein
MVPQRRGRLLVGIGLVSTQRFSACLARGARMTLFAIRSDDDEQKEPYTNQEQSLKNNLLPLSPMNLSVHHTERHAVLHSRRILRSDINGYQDYEEKPTRRRLRGEAGGGLYSRLLGDRSLTEGHSEKARRSGLGKPGASLQGGVPRPG